MSVRVNLLPAEVDARARASRMRAGAGLAGVGLLAALGVVFVWENGRVNDVKAELAAEEQELAALQAEVQEFADYAELDRRAGDSGEILASALASDVSFAGLLQDVAAVTPEDVEYTSMTITLTEPIASLGDVRPAFGELTLVGYALDHAPGVERLLIELDKVAAFGDLFFATGFDDEFGDITFTVTADLGPEVFTNRYVDGLPEALR